MKYCEKCFQPKAFILSTTSCMHNFCVRCNSSPHTINFLVTCPICDGPYTDLSLTQWRPLHSSDPETCGRCAKFTYAIIYYYECNHVICPRCFKPTLNDILRCPACCVVSPKVSIRNTNQDISMTWKTKKTITIIDLFEYVFVVVMNGVPVVIPQASN